MDNSQAEIDAIKAELAAISKRLESIDRKSGYAIIADISVPFSSVFRLVAKTVIALAAFGFLLLIILLMFPAVLNILP